MKDPTEKSDSEQATHGEPVQISARLDLRYLRAGEHTIIIPIPDDIALLMARVIILWGAFELRMDAVIEFLIPALGKTEPPTWKFMSFDKRKTLFKNLTLEYTTRMFPCETETFRKLTDQAGDLQWRRNTVAHGFIKGRSTPNANSPTGYDVVFYAVNRHKGKDVQIDLDNPTLEKLRHDIGHLGGNLMAAISRMGGHLMTTSPEIVVADRDFLQDSPTGNLQVLPTWKPPQSAP